MSKMGIYFSDRKNINRKSFGKIFNYLDENEVPYSSDDDSVCFKFGFGCYKELKSCSMFMDMYSKYNVMSDDEILHISYFGINLIDVYLYEALSFFLTIDNFRATLRNKTSREDIFNAMISVDRDTLIMCVCISIFWAEYWILRWREISKYKYVGIFSGAQIYNMMLIEISKRSQFSPLLMESFFTGNEFYLEKKYEPIPNNSNVKFANVYRSLNFNYNRLNIENAYQKIIKKKNKNKTECQSKNISIDKKNASRVITIVAQVVNDFSIICTFKNYLNTIEFYKNAIDLLLMNDDNYLIIKTHPWEKFKNKTNITYNEIKSYIFTKPADQISRFKLIESWDIDELCEKSDFIMTLCSQAGIECAMRGKKIIQFGNAFYGGKGFSHDYSTLDDFMNDFNSGLIYPSLSSDEMKNFNEFLSKMFSSFLVSNSDSVNSILDRYFQ